MNTHKATVSEQQYQMRVALPYEVKVARTLQMIRQWYRAHCGKVHVAYSGGLDSTVLLHLARQRFPDIQAVFINTGLEYPEVLDQVRKTDNVIWMKPFKTFSQIIEKYGYPVVSKTTAQYVENANNSLNNTPSLRLRLTGYNKRGEYTPEYSIPRRWLRLLDAPFRVSDKCCRFLKKEPGKRADELYGPAMIGTRATESRLRRANYKRYGCNAFNLKRPLSMPLSIWTDEDIWRYVHENKLPYCSLYDQGHTSTGCMFCLFGIQVDGSPNRFERMATSHPAQWRYCMDKLGIREVCRFLRVPSGDPPGAPAG